MPLPGCLRPRSPDLGGIVLLAFGYAAFVLFGLEWAVVPGAGTSVWPAAGLAPGVLMLAGPRLGLGGAALGATISAGVGMLALAVNGTAPSQLLSAGVNLMRTVDDLLTRAAPRNAA